MRKMPYAILFIVILAILVFAGCKAFKLGGDDTTDPDESISATDETFESEATVPVETTTLPAVPEEVTDEAGQTVYTPEEVSSVYEAISASVEASESLSNNPEATTAAPTTTRPSESTTQGGGATSTTAEPTTAAPVVPTKNEYDILRGGKFYLMGSMYADGENNPITLAVGDDLVYMQATMDGVTLGFLIQDKKTYLINTEQKTYCEFGSMMSSILQQAGMMSEDEILEYIDNMGFSTMDDLEDADEKTTGTIGSTSCDVYIFNKSDGTKTRVYMNGNRLMAFEIVNTDGLVDSATYITTLSEDIPRLPPPDYTKQNVLTFISSMEELIGE